MATKTKTSTKTKAATKPARKGTTKPKAARKGTIGKGDDARKVAAASDGDLVTGQVRVLRYLAGRKNPATMAEVKDGVGIGAENKYSATWLSGVHELRDYDYVKVESHPTEGTGRAAFHYSITATGRKALATAEKAAKAAE